LFIGLNLLYLIISTIVYFSNMTLLHSAVFSIQGSQGFRVFGFQLALCSNNIDN